MTPRRFSPLLLDWYTRLGRDLPWRHDPPDPYRVWISEIMLQQTTVATVANRFTAFLDRFPNLNALAEASQPDLLEAWAGLGYYARARNLHHAAQVVMTDHQGRLPEDVAALRRLPGIGHYTAAAIAAIAFNIPAPAIDSNVKRVFARIQRIRKPIADNEPALLNFWRLSEQDHAPRDHLQAWMDFGELLCTPRSPQCTACPLAKDCKGRDIADTLPVKPAKKPRQQLYTYGYWLEDGQGNVWLRRRPSKGLLGGMLEVPTAPWQPRQPAPDVNMPQTVWQDSGLSIAHRFTHIDLTVWLLTGRASLDLTPFGHDSTWYPLDQIPQLGLPTLYLKIARQQPLANRSWK